MEIVGELCTLSDGDLKFSCVNSYEFSSTLRAEDRGALSAFSRLVRTRQRDKCSSSSRVYVYAVGTRVWVNTALCESISRILARSFPFEQTNDSDRERQWEKDTNAPIAKCSSDQRAISLLEIQIRTRGKYSCAATVLIPGIDSDLTLAVMCWNIERRQWV